MNEWISVKEGLPDKTGYYLYFYENRKHDGLQKRKKKMKDQTISKVSNIVQFDDMGYPLILCITNDGKQIWIDVSEEYACKGIKEGNLKIIEWKKNV